MIKINKWVYGISTKVAEFLHYLFSLFLCHAN